MVLGKALADRPVLISAVESLGVTGILVRNPLVSFCVERSEQSRSHPLLATEGPEREGRSSSDPDPASHPPLSRCLYPSAGRAVPQKVPTVPYSSPSPSSSFLEALDVLWTLCDIVNKRLCAAAGVSPAGAASNRDGLNQPSLQASGLALTDRSVRKVAPAGFRELWLGNTLALEPFLAGKEFLSRTGSILAHAAVTYPSAYQLVSFSSSLPSGLS